MPICPNCGTEFVVEEHNINEEKDVQLAAMEMSVEETKIREEGETERERIRAEAEVEAAKVVADTITELPPEVIVADGPETTKEDVKDIVEEVVKEEEIKEDKKDDEVIEESVKEIPTKEEVEPDTQPANDDVRPKSRHKWWG